MTEPEAPVEGAAPPAEPVPAPVATSDTEPPAGPAAAWLAEAEAELKKIPFFVRGKARRNTERYAAERQIPEISLATLYEAKAHYGR
jgi:light-independent protochlorophyllide reductase subunit B